MTLNKRRMLSMHRRSGLQLDGPRAESRAPRESTFIYTPMREDSLPSVLVETAIGVMLFAALTAALFSLGLAVLG